MTDRKSSSELAHVASRVMSEARQGGPVQARRQQLIDAMAETGGGTPVVLDCVERVLRPYIDDAERLAASVLSQAKK